MTFLRKLLGNWWLVSITAAILAALVLCLGLPLVFRGLGTPVWRLGLLAMVAAVWAGFALWRQVSARRASDAIARSLAASERDSGEEATLSRRMSDALAQLKSAGPGRRDYLYDRPWYVIIGPPGAGKTTALLKSGLQFPFADTALKGVGGTRNLDFWFADEAVLVDTAGRYTSQDMGDSRDEQGWRAFLDLLRRNRPLQPINGVFVAIALDELAQADVATVDRHAATVRRRLAELKAGLEVSPPVYVMFTKADLVAGFCEYFDDLDVDGRRAVMGSTLPWSPGGRADAAALTQAFDDMAQAIADRTPRRLQEEQDARRRALILGFPLQVQALRSRVVRLLEGAFPAGEAAASATLRGFYFTSGVQEGTPLDRIVSDMAQVYDAPARTPAGGGRAYFINRLLKEVAFPEAGLVQVSPALARRRRASVVAALSGIAAFCLLTLVAWSVSYVQNRHFQDELQARAEQVSRQAAEAGVDLTLYNPASDASLEQAAPILKALRELPRGFEASSRGGPPLSMRFGLFQRGMQARARQAYLGGGQRILMPRLLVRLEETLGDRSDPVGLYERLRVYLMLGGFAPKMEPKAVTRWAGTDWATGSLQGSDRSDIRDALAADLNNVVSDPGLGRIWGRARRAPLDPALIQSARATVSAMPAGDRVYAILVQRAQAQGSGMDWSVDEKLANGAERAFADGRALRAIRIPFFFTRQGYSFYKRAFNPADPQLAGESWVLGQQKPSSLSQLESLRSAVATLYANDYERAWDGLLAAMRPADYFNDPEALMALGGTPSAPAFLLRELRDNTSLSATLEAGAAKALKQRMLSGKPAFVGESLNKQASSDPGAQIEQHFRDVNRYSGEGAPSRLDKFIELLKAYVQARNAVQSAQGGPGTDTLVAAMATAKAALDSAADEAPQALQGFAGQVASGVSQSQTSTNRVALAGAYTTSVLADCQAATRAVFPFEEASKQDATLSTMTRVFGQGQGFDAFIRGRLLEPGLIDASGPIWRWRQDNPLAQSLDPDAARMFGKADQIGSLLVDGVTLQVEAIAFGGSATAATFTADGVPHRFESGGSETQTVVWRAGGNYPAEVSLFAGVQKTYTAREVGPWALQRLLSPSRTQNAAPDLSSGTPHARFQARFSQGAAYVTFQFTLDTETNPFGRGFWSFRCPDKV